MALVMAIGITSVLGIAGATAVAYSTSGAQESQQSGARQNAFSLAEAGIDDSMGVLNLPTNNALDPDTLNKCTSNETKYGTAGSTPTSVSTWRHDSYANGRRGLVRHAQPQHGAVVPDLDREHEEPRPNGIRDAHAAGDRLGRPEP